MKVLAVIPARIGSTRLKRKMLADIHGKPLVWHTWTRAMQAKRVSHVIVATDSLEIRDALLPLGADIVMTPASIKTGSDRVAEAVRRFKRFTPDIVLNVQGDEPLIPPRAIDLAVEALLKDRSATMATVASPITKPKELNDPNVVKVALDRDHNALYFSRSVIPYKREKTSQKIYKHFGIYAFRTGFLKEYVDLPRTPLERTESLEQLRVLEHGFKIKVALGKFDHIEVNTKAELEEVRRILRK